MSLKE